MTIKIPFFVIKLLKFLKIYNLSKYFYHKYFKYSGFLKDDIESTLFHIFLNLKRNSVYVDIGAHKGIKIDTAYNANREIIVYAFEAFKSYYLFLKKKYIKKDNIYLFNSAIYKRNQIRKFYYNNKKLDQEAFSLKKKFHKYIIVNALTLDKAISKKIIPDIVKVDVEGSEIDVIKGCNQAIKKKAVFFIETTEKTLSIINNILKSKNYYCYIYEYNFFKKKIKNLWLSSNVIKNNIFEKNIYTIDCIKDLNNKFMINIVAIHKDKLQFLSKKITILKKINNFL